MARVVIDASVVLRLVLDRSAAADEVVARNELTAPGLVLAETANGLAMQVRFAGLPLDDAVGQLEDVLALGIELVPDGELVADAVAEALKRELTAHDAAYVALAERLQAPLLTADRSLADRYDRCELIP